MAVFAEIERKFETNLARVENLVSLYSPRRGRTKVHDSDILRASVVMLHASLEDFLRSLLVWKIEQFDEATLTAYGFPSGRKRGKEKITLGELSAHKGKTVDALIEEAVASYLVEYSTFNDLGEVKKALIQCEVPSATLDAHDFGRLPEMISRRHDIVHKADRDEAARGRGNHKTKSIGKPTVEKYIQAVQNLKIVVADELG